MKIFFLAALISLMSLSVYAIEHNHSSENAQVDEENYTSAGDLPKGAVVDPLFETSSGRPVCPKGYVVAKKYCWSFKRFSFRHCGYFCNKVSAPEHGKH